MCDLQGKLVAWLDHELPQDEAAEVGRHIQGCAECRSERETYAQVSKTFDGYCEAVMAAKTQRRVPRWVPALSGAVVAVAVLLLTFPRARVEPPPVVTPTAAAAPVKVLASEPAPRKTIHKRHAVPAIHEQAEKWQPAETAVQIAIPAETMFAPGAIPEGMNFIAELSIGPDGAVERLRLRP
jgi:anti-sigma factor RsiW